MIGYGRQSIDASDLQAVQRVLEGPSLTCGPAIEEFEAAICTVTGAPHAVAVADGTSALRLLYQVAGIGPGTRVGVPAITFVATASQALRLGAEVVLLDVDPDTLLLTPTILAACRQHLDVVVPVHIAGRLCDLTGLAEVAAARGCRLLEDAAHAFGSTWLDGGRCGDCRQSQGAIFSFHPVKNITTGEGGAIVVGDAGLDRRLRSWRHHGIIRSGFQGDLAATDAGAPWYHEFHAPAGNDRLSDLHAALGASQCRRLASFKMARAAIVQRYRQELGGLGWLHLAPEAVGQDPFWHLCLAHADFAAVGLDRRTVFQRGLAAGIAFQVHYIPLHHQPVLAQAERAGPLAGADRAYARVFTLPCYVGLTTDEQDRVIRFLRALGTSGA